MIHSEATHAVKRYKEKQNYFEELLEVFAKIKGDKLLLREFLSDLLSPVELEEVSRRWQIVKLLRRGLSHREIAKEVHTSIATITRGSREMANEEGGFQKVLDLVSKK